MSISSAIQNRKLIRFSYDGHLRTVEPHTCGIDTKGHASLRAYQIAGTSSSGEYRGWKIFHINDMRGMTVLEDTFAAPRPDYKRSDKAFSVIHAQV